MQHLLSRTATTRNLHLTYELSFFEDTNRKGRILGRISYVFPSGKSIMSQGHPFDIRRFWHSLCRINRARLAGRDYLKLINGHDPREARFLGLNPPAKA